MPFKEIKQPSGFIRIKINGAVTISATLLSLFPNKVKVFHDFEKRKIGLKPDIDGYKIYLGRIKCAELPKITTGEFYPKWSENRKMLIFSY